MNGSWSGFLVVPYLAIGVLYAFIGLVGGLVTAGGFLVFTKVLFQIVLGIPLP